MPACIEVALRALFLLTIVFIMAKLLGKKQLSHLNIFEYITGIVLGSIVADLTINLNTPLIYGLIALLVWFIIPMLIQVISLKSIAFRRFIDGKSTVLIQDGKILEDNLKKEKYTTDDLLEKMRQKNIFLASDVEFATLEPSGTISFLLKKENQPLTAKDLGVKLAPEKEPQTIIMDGKVILESLANLSLNPNWLEEELSKMNIALENVFLAQADTDGQLYVDLYDEKITVPEPAEKPLLLATLKKCQADPEVFALATENENSKQLYEKNSQKLQSVIDMVSPYL